MVLSWVHFQMLGAFQAAALLKVGRSLAQLQTHDAQSGTDERIEYMIDLGDSNGWGAGRVHLCWT